MGDQVYKSFLASMCLKFALVYYEKNKMLNSRLLFELSNRAMSKLNSPSVWELSFVGLCCQLSAPVTGA